MRVSLLRLALSLMATVVFIAGPQRAAAQTGTASLSGTVTDEQKSAVPGATVTLTSATTGVSRETISGEGGAYTFVAMPPGVYGLKVELAGFKTTVVEKVTLNTDSAQRLDVSLAVGAIVGRRVLQRETFE